MAWNLTPEQEAKRIAAVRGYWDSERSSEARVKFRLASEEALKERGSYNKGRFGEENSNWKGGRENWKDPDWLHWRGPDWNLVRLAALERDGHKCQHCGIAASSGRGNGLHVHHIVDWKETQDNSLENLIVLCASCHNKIHPKEGRSK